MLIDRNNQPAFPRVGPEGNEGMTMREYYAGQAMVGLLMGNGIALAVEAGSAVAKADQLDDFEGVMGKVAQIAWRVADVMLLEGGPSQQVN